MLKVLKKVLVDAFKMQSEEVVAFIECASGDVFLVAQDDLDEGIAHDADGLDYENSQVYLRLPHIDDTSAVLNHEALVTWFETWSSQNGIELI